MVDIKKVSATITMFRIRSSDPANTNDVAPDVFSGDTLLIRQGTTAAIYATDPFSIIQDRTITNTIGNPGLNTQRIVTGFVIPFSRVYSLHLEVSPQLYEYNSTVPLPSNLETYRNTFMVASFQCNLYVLRSTGEAFNPAQTSITRDPGYLFGTNTAGSPSNTFTRHKMNSRVTSIFNLYAGDFVYAACNYELFLPEGTPDFSGQEPKLYDSPRVTIRLEELTDL